MRLTWAKRPGALLLLGASIALAQEPAAPAPEQPVVKTPEQPAAETKPAPSQGGVIKGQVTATYGDPLPGSLVEVKGTKLAARTDANGEYTLSGVPAGNQTL